MKKDHQETWPGDSVLGRRIWSRYASAPGVISTESASRLSRRTTSVGRLPLLADVQRRWMPRGEAWPHGGSALLYARLASSTEPLSLTPGGGSRPSYVASAETRPPTARVVVPSANAGRSVQREVASTSSIGSPELAAEEAKAIPSAAETIGLGAEIVQRHRATPVGQAAQLPRTGTEPASAADDHPPVTRVSHPSGGSKPTVLSGGGDLGPTIVQRHRDTLAAQPQPQTISTGPTSTIDHLSDVSPSRPPGEQRAPVPSAGGGDLGPAIVQRYRGAPVGRSGQMQVASPESVILSKAVEPSFGQPTQSYEVSANPVGVADRPLVERSSRLAGESVAPVSSAGGDLGPAIVQRYRGTPVGRSGQAEVASPKAATLSQAVEPLPGQTARVQRAVAKSLDATDRPLVESPAHPADESRPSAAQTSPAVSGTASAADGGTGASMMPVGPVVSSSGDLGTAIVQRHLGGPVGRVAQTRLALSGAASDQPLVEPPSSRPDVEAGLLAAGARFAVRDGSASDLGATILQRHLGGPVGRAGERQHLTVVPGPTHAARQEVANVQRSPTSLERRSSTSNVRESTASALVFGRGIVEPRTGVAFGRAEMPLARAAGGGNASLVQAHSPGSGAWATVVQRDAAETTAASEAGTPAGEPAPLTEVPSGAEAPDLERLADEVYAIIERRLIIERESRGL